MKIYISILLIMGVIGCEKNNKIAEIIELGIELPSMSLSILDPKVKAGDSIVGSVIYTPKGYDFETMELWHQVEKITTYGLKLKNVVFEYNNTEYNRDTIVPETRYQTYTHIYENWQRNEFVFRHYYIYKVNPSYAIYTLENLFDGKANIDTFINQLDPLLKDSIIYEEMINTLTREDWKVLLHTTGKINDIQYDRSYDKTTAPENPTDTLYTLNENGKILFRTKLKDDTNFYKEQLDEGAFLIEIKYQISLHYRIANKEGELISAIRSFTVE